MWSAGAVRPGLIEPMEVHENHRGRGLGRAINLAAATVLRTVGASSASVYTPSSNTGGVATYARRGFVALPSVLDRLRPSASISS
ncbi:GNAT family N-acetyltransferase [Nocardioides sp. AE5]|uniref:GNAT family N-acetyltransferase n=1 Tax=Nocardioides sp. AE5 TaxID=2962573 RepID=UPI0037C6F152